MQNNINLQVLFTSISIFLMLLPLKLLTMFRNS